MITLMIAWVIACSVAGCLLFPFLGIGVFFSWCMLFSLCVLFGASSTRVDVALFGCAPILLIFAGVLCGGNVLLTLFFEVEWIVGLFFCICAKNEASEVKPRKDRYDWFCLLAVNIPFIFSPISLYG